MGWFSKIFKKKKGGTKVGNFIRGAANSISDGKYGNGEQLQRWEQSQYNSVQNPIDRIAVTPAYRLGNPFGTAVKPYVEEVANSQGVKDIKKSMTKEWLKKNAIYIGLGILIVPVLIIGAYKMIKGK